MKENTTSRNTKYLYYQQMENSELQTQIISLGKLLVSELGLDSSVDTFSKWMAHYLAEKITLAEQLPPGESKKRG